MKWFKNLFKKKTDLRDLVFQELGQDGVDKYDNLSSGIPIGGLVETCIFLDAIETIKKKYDGKWK